MIKSDNLPNGYLTLIAPIVIAYFSYSCSFNVKVTPESGLWSLTKLNIMVRFDRLVDNMTHDADADDDAVNVV